ncbi:hypothetical protein HOC35_01200 [Candidatus Woesearchaeota archaeon]|mgnify:FL=1|jgi:hypothetical protein|nr:hypothetical protein [Candidatus Woesearchaeota archaeon]
MSDKPKLDIVIANTSYIKNRFEDLIEMHLDDVADEVGFEYKLKLEKDSYLHQTELIPQNALVMTHLGAYSDLIKYLPLKVVRACLDPEKGNRLDLRFILTIDGSYLSRNYFTEDYEDKDGLFDFLKSVSEKELDPANNVSPIFERDPFEFFDSQEFKDYMKKYVEMRQINECNN